MSVGPSGTGVVQTAELKSKIAAKKPSTRWGGQVTTMKPRPLYPGPRFQGKKVALLPLESGSHAWWTVMTDSGPSLSLQRESRVIPLLENSMLFPCPTVALLAYRPAGCETVTEAAPASAITAGWQRNTFRTTQE